MNAVKKTLEYTSIRVNKELLKKISEIRKRENINKNEVVLERLLNGTLQSDNKQNKSKK